MLLKKSKYQTSYTLYLSYLESRAVFSALLEYAENHSNDNDILSSIARSFSAQYHSYDEVSDSSHVFNTGFNLKNK